MSPDDVLGALAADPARGLIACDIDGTLAPIVTLAKDARADPDAVSALGKVADRVGRTVLLTGRPAGVAAGLGAFPSIPGLVILGHYGLDQWEAGAVTAPPPDPAVARARARVPALPAGAYVEDKGLSFVVHTRPAADPVAALAELDPLLRQLAASEGLEVVDGSFAREIRPRGVDKGTALGRLIAASEPSAVVYLGDDDGDLPAAGMLAEQGARGLPTLVVCAERAGGSLALRARADVVVPGVAGVTRWLEELAHRLP